MQRTTNQELAEDFGRLVLDNLYTNTSVETVAAWARFAGRYGLRALADHEAFTHALLAFIPKALMPEPSDSVVRR